MEIKHNDSTLNRPFGERPIDAPVVPVDLHAYTQQLMEEEAWQKSDRNAITVFKTDQMTVVLVALHKGAEVKPATVDGTGVMNLQVLEGSLRFSTEADNIQISRGQMVNLHEHIAFSAIALEECVCLLTMTRENNLQ